jgi:glycosyltransferase involved in cell wall biosynthesis
MKILGSAATPLSPDTIRGASDELENAEEGRRSRSLRRPNILLLVKGLGRGGAEYIVSRTALLGDRTRFNYEIAYVLSHKNALVDGLCAANVPVHCVGDRVTWPSRLRSLIRDRRIDLVHGHSPVPATAARLVAGGTVRHVYTEHNVWPRYARATRTANELTFARNCHIFAVSDEVGRSTRRRIGGSPPFVETLRYGIDPDEAVPDGQRDGVRAQFDIDRSSPLIVTVANFKPHKGHATLLEAAVSIRRAMPQATFLLAGVGPLERAMRRRAIELGLGESVVFAGLREDAPRLASAGDVFVLPSDREGLPIALVEAMAAGRPSVATHVGGVPEVLTDGREGFLVPPMDPEALAEAVVTLLADARLRDKMGCAARARAADFDIRKAIRRTEEVYEEVLS